ncbi:RING-H2 finger protein ATL39-like [Triticum urartu]|uniref:RING-H2 finger protein ATL39-like n=1 Tax=Triticum urartu TaxID=4572 RepID=UPI002043925E|nr:RING-H2 finger protein ATL39-like [Triticum urartu]
MSSSAAADLPWQARGSRVFDVGQGSALVLVSYPVLLLLVLLSAFVRYVWIALALYCAILFVLSCTGRLLAGPEVLVHDEATAAIERGGLPQASIAAIPAFVYTAAASAGAGDGDAQCAVCLEALSGGEKARRLPVCAHTFHVGCIDMWFHSHATCPVCRCHVEPQKSGKMAPLPAEPPLPPV